MGFHAWQLYTVVSESNSSSVLSVYQPICILKSNPRQEDFRTVARHIKCLFLQVRGESGPLV